MNKHSEILAALEAPFPPEVIRHRVGAGGKDLQWVDARTISARLDHVLGISAWDFAVEPVGDTTTVLGILTIRFPDGSVARRQDFGYETGGSGESLKEASSDALRRCASLFGAARALYGGEKPAAGRIGLPALKPMSLPQTPAPAVGHDTVVLKAAMAMFGNDNCPDHGQPWTLKPGGVSKATSKPYAPFWACSARTDGAFCRKKPSIDFINSQAAPLGEPVKTEEDLSELPF
jgi:hypothetical protein